MSDAAHSPEAIRKHIKTYIAVFIALGVLTVVTVAVSYLHLPLWKAVAVALFVASVKGGLVAAYFMHLISEQKIVTYLLYLTLFFFVFLLIVPFLAQYVA